MNASKNSFQQPIIVLPKKLILTFLGTLEEGVKLHRLGGHFSRQT